jgi:hypothetical protein
LFILPILGDNPYLDCLNLENLSVMMSSLLFCDIICGFGYPNVDLVIPIWIRIDYQRPNPDFDIVTNYPNPDWDKIRIGT